MIVSRRLWLSWLWRIRVICQDISQPEATKDLVSDYDLVTNAVPGYLGFKSLKACLEAGRKVVDISFSRKILSELDSLAKEQNITAAVDCGVAPGLSNILAGYGLSQLDQTFLSIFMSAVCPSSESGPSNTRLFSLQLIHRGISEAGQMPGKWAGRN